MALKKGLFGSFKCFYKSGIISLLKRCPKERILGYVRLQLQNQSGGSRMNLIWRSNLNLTRSFGDSDDFSIWGSSRSAVASNLHALPYEVVVLELLAPEYSGGLDLYLQIQNQSGALRVDALSNMATLPMYATHI